MKILIATIYDYPHAGGLSSHVTTLKAGLEAREHTVDVLSFSNISPILRKLLVQGPSFLMNKLNKGHGILWSHSIRKFLLQTFIEKNQHYDLIHAQDPITTLAAVATGIPTVSTVHGYMAFELVSKGSINANSKEAKKLQKLEIEAYQKTRRIITVDQRLHQYVQEVSEITGTPIRNFIDVYDFQPNKSRKNQLRSQLGISADEHVLFVPRRLTRKNGVIYPALALPTVLKRYPNTRLIYAGSGEAITDIKKIISEHRLEKNVELLGAISHERIKDYYASSDVVLVPSVHSSGVEEATSISALEAMGSGSPLIACAVGGLKEIVDPNKDGLLVEEKNIEALAKAIIYLLDNPKIGAEMARLARKKIETEYSHITAAAKYEEIYLQALQEK